MSGAAHRPEYPGSPAAAAAPPVRIVRLDTLVHRVAIDPPVVTAFGRMTDRPGLLVRVEAADGAAGWGEVWCNFPACGAEHRARLVESVLAPRLLGRELDTPGPWTATTARQLHTLALQTGEPGPLAQALAGVDVALWDLAARRRGRPLRRLLAGARAANRLPVYASGINPDDPAATVARCRAEGHTAFKLKVGFGRARDAANAAALAGALRTGERWMADANQGLGVAGALAFAADVAAHPPEWLEEPLAADAPAADWAAVAQAGLPLAAGENAASHAAFRALIAAPWLAVLQPDLCKWGGVTGVLPIARAALAAGKRYCPHYLGGGLGLAASAQLLAAAGGDGLLEIDSNPNPLRTAMTPGWPEVQGGWVTLGDGPGVGCAPDLDSLAPWLVRREVVEAVASIGSV